MKVAVPVTAEGDVDPRWGRANRIAVADVVNGAVAAWEEYDVHWDTLHDDGTEGAHHARIARFLRDHAIEVVAVQGVGPGMARMLTTMDVRVHDAVGADAREAARAAATES